MQRAGIAGNEDFRLFQHGQKQGQFRHRRQNRRAGRDLFQFILELADENGILDHVAADLRGLKALLAESKDMRRLVRSPILSRAEQEKAMAAILEQANADRITRNFVALAARNRRLFALSGIIDAYLAMLAERRGEVTAEVTAANPLSESQQKTLAETLRKLVGAKVAVELRIDRELLGGLIVKVGSRLFDSSLRTKLRKLELVMKGVG